MSLRFHPLALLALLSMTTAACAASSVPAEDDAAADDAALTAKTKCSQPAYDAAFAHYKSAVEHSKARLRGAVCDDGTMLSDIAADLGAAVASCGQFKTVLAQSKWAAPARDALAGNLALPALDGRLDADSLAGLGESLPGTTVYGPAPGVYGNMSKITFQPGGAAIASSLDVPDDGSAPRWKDAPARWSLGTAHGGAITVTITVGGEATAYTLKMERALAPYDHLPEFVLTPDAGDAYRSLPSECEA
jgi:hypothetical protein